MLPSILTPTPLPQIMELAHRSCEMATSFLDSDNYVYTSWELSAIQSCFLEGAHSPAEAHRHGIYQWDKWDQRDRWD